MEDRNSTGLVELAAGVARCRAMILITAQMRVLVAIEPVDGRKGIDSLVRRCRPPPTKRRVRIRIGITVYELSVNVAIAPVALSARAPLIVVPVVSTPNPTFQREFSRTLSKMVDLINLKEK